MSSYDENSYSTESYSVSAWDFGAVIEAAWKGTKRFTLNVVTQVKVALGAP